MLRNVRCFLGPGQFTASSPMPLKRSQKSQSADLIRTRPGELNPSPRNQSPRARSLHGMSGCSMVGACAPADGERVPRLFSVISLHPANRLPLAMPAIQTPEEHGGVIIAKEVAVMHLAPNVEVHQPSFYGCIPLRR